MKKLTQDEFVLNKEELSSLLKQIEILHKSAISNLHAHRQWAVEEWHFPVPFPEREFDAEEIDIEAANLIARHLLGE